MTTVTISHFSDVLCVWAYISQIRVAELEANYPSEVGFDYHYLHLFGDVDGKLAAQWADRGGAAGYAEHVREAAAGFDHVRLHENVWLEHRPKSSLPAHLLICAARVLERDVPAARGAARRLDTAVRRAFFEDNADVSDGGVLRGVAGREGLDVAALERRLASGEAHARFAADLQLAEKVRVRASPTLAFNDARQVLTGNVGYRVIEANVTELLRAPGDRQSWC